MKTKKEVLNIIRHNTKEVLSICDYCDHLLVSGHYREFDGQLDMVISECEETISNIRKHNLMDPEKKYKYLLSIIKGNQKLITG